MKNTNTDLARFCINKIGTPYVMGTNGRTFTQSMYADLVRRNPGDWFTAARLPVVRGYTGRQTTDCHGLIEWFVREQTGQAYDTTADMAYSAAHSKGSIDTIPEISGVCVRYKGHVGVYIGGGYVVEARGFDYGVCITQLRGRPWTHWYKHPKIKYTGTALPMPSPAKVGRTTDRYSVVWLQLSLNRQLAAGVIKGEPLTVDGIYGSRTARTAAAFWKKKGWTEKDEVWGVGKNTVKALGKET